jgi:hypothetical protein
MYFRRTGYLSGVCISIQLNFCFGHELLTYCGYQLMSSVALYICGS